MSAKNKNPHATTRNGRLCNHSLFVSTAQPEALQDSSFNKTFVWPQDDLRCRSQEPIQTTFRPLDRQLTQKVKIPATPTSLRPHARGTQKRRCHLAPLHTPNHIRRTVLSRASCSPDPEHQALYVVCFSYVHFSSVSPHLHERTWHGFPESFLGLDLHIQTHISAP